MQMTLLKLAIVAIYPIIILISFLLIYRKYKEILKKNTIQIIINTVIISIIIFCGLLLFFHFENTIYAYDYAGHWIRALTLKQHFNIDPNSVLKLVYDSMNNADYSYLPALFELPLMLFKQSYKWFAVCNYVLFLLPTIVLLQILYFKYINKNKFLPITVVITIYPLYLTLFYGKVDCCGLFFLVLAYSLIILPKFNEVDIVDNLSINLFSFLAIFLRRWYLYSIVCLYLAYFIKWLFYKEKKTSDLLKLISSGIVLLTVCLLFFMPFINNSINNNFEEAYAVYNNDGKLQSFVNYISPVVCLICIVGLVKLLKENKELLIINLVSIVIPCLMIWRVQSFEFHHYYIFLLNIIILFVYGLTYLNKLHKLIPICLMVLLLIQPFVIFSNITNTMPVFTNIRKLPEQLGDKEELIALSEYIKSIEPDENTTAFLCAGSYGIITDDLLRNALLPDLDSPNIDSAVFDIRDGIPKDLQYIKYIITVDPIIYTDRNYQHMFDIIDNAVRNDEIISKIYNPIYSIKLHDTYTVTVYERIGEYTNEIKEHFYKEMLKYYPDKTDYFSYILD